MRKFNFFAKVINYAIVNHSLNLITIRDQIKAVPLFTLNSICKDPGPI